MPLNRLTGNILDAKTEAILIAVDGDHQTMVGAVGHQLAKRIGDEDEWDRIMHDAQFPISPGDVTVVSLEDVPEVEFRYVIVGCGYNHNNKRLYLDFMYYNALCYATNWGIKSLATVLYKGGWRGTVEEATKALDAAVYKGGWRGTVEEATKALDAAVERFPNVAVELYSLPTRDK